MRNTKLSFRFKEKIHNTCYYNRFIITGVIKIATFSCLDPFCAALLGDVKLKHVLQGKRQRPLL